MQKKHYVHSLITLHFLDFCRSCQYGGEDEYHVNTRETGNNGQEAAKSEQEVEVTQDPINSKAIVCAKSHPSYIEEAHIEVTIHNSSQLPARILDPPRLEMSHLPGWMLTTSVKQPWLLLPLLQHARQWHFCARVHMLLLYDGFQIQFIVQALIAHWALGPYHFPFSLPAE